MYYQLEPEVAGGWGPATVRDRVNPNHLLVFEYRFDGWLGDELLTSHPYFIITEQLSLLMEPAKLSGYDLAEVIISKSEIFEDLYLFRILPAFVWLKVDGHAGRDDFGISSSKKLSEKSFVGP